MDAFSNAPSKYAWQDLFGADATRDHWKVEKIHQSLAFLLHIFMWSGLWGPWLQMAASQLPTHRAHSLVPTYPNKNCKHRHLRKVQGPYNRAFRSSALTRHPLTICLDHSTFLKGQNRRVSEYYTRSWAHLMALGLRKWYCWRVSSRALEPNPYQIS